VSAGVQVRGNATPEELGAVVAVLAQLERGPQIDRYAEWRRVRLAALRAGPNDRRGRP
jgi:hypothetical protein